MSRGTDESGHIRGTEESNHRGTKALRARNKAILCVSVPLWLILFLCLVLSPCLSALSAPPPAVRIYDANPQHLWNRLHAALFVRVGPDGREYGGDRVDPLLWIGSKYLLKGPAHEYVVHLLREFVDTHAERLIDDPLKRALLQRDLWMVFDWLEGEHTNFLKPLLSTDEVRRGAEQLRSPLATIIGRLALTREQIDGLPDNYAAAGHAVGMPADLFAPNGPWINVGRPDGPIARIHVNDLGPGKNSVFLVLIRLPGGREATLRYLERLRAFNGRLWLDHPAMVQFLAPYPNPALPQFPVDTEVALVRRALLIDSAGDIVPSKMTESIQHRVYHAIEAMTPQAFADAHRIDPEMFARAGQDFEEFSLSRAALLARRDGGLLPIASVERFFLTFMSQGFDEFEMQPAGPTRRIGADAADAKRVCKDCHGAPGVYSFNSYAPFRLMNGPNGAAAPQLSELSIADAQRTAVSWKQRRPEWLALKELLTR